ncbi:protease propeptide/inhibitor [Mycena crocata]|nr:protease propeptide/inhibitor [Mycena crocata]
MSGKYIVVFKSTASQAAIDKFAETVSSDGKSSSAHQVHDRNPAHLGGEVTHRYDTLMKGFAAKLNENTLAKFNSLQAESDSIIDYIEPDGVVTTQ